MSKVRGMKGMANNVIYERREIAPNTYLWQGEDEILGRGFVHTWPMPRTILYPDNDNREHFIMGLPSRQ